MGSLALPDRPVTGTFQKFKDRETVQIAELLTFSRKSSQFWRKCPHVPENWKFILFGI